MNSATPMDADEMAALSQRLSKLEATCVSQQRFNDLLEAERNYTGRLARIYALFWIVLAFATAAVGVQQYLNRADRLEIRKEFHALVEREKEKLSQEIRALPIRACVDGAVKKMTSGSDAQRDSAIWHDIKPLLERSQGKAQFYDAATIVSEEFLPFIDLAPSNGKFRDSYRHQLWICAYLLESDIEPVVRAVKDHVPSVDVIGGVVREHLDDPVVADRKDLEASWARLRNRLETP